jgi:hypothetical protein
VNSKKATISSPAASSHRPQATQGASDEPVALRRGGLRATVTPRLLPADHPRRCSCSVVVAVSQASTMTVPRSLRTSHTWSQQAANRRPTPCNQSAVADTQRQQTPRSDALSKHCWWSGDGDACVHTAVAAGFCLQVAASSRYGRAFGLWRGRTVVDVAMDVFHALVAVIAQGSIAASHAAQSSDVTPA